MAAPAAELFIRMAADVATLKTDFDKATRHAERFARDVKRTLSTVAGALGVSFGIAGITAFIKSGIDAQAMLDDMAEKTSLTVETLSSLERTARIGGHSIDAVASGASKFARSVAEAAGGNKQLVAAFEALGISQERLRTQKFDELYVEFAKKIATAENQTFAIAFATRLAGKSAAESIPFWRDLAETGLEQGQVTTQQAAAAERLQKEWNRLLDIAHELKLGIASGLTPALTDWIEAQREAIKIAGGIGNALRLFVFNLDAMTTEKPVEEIRRLTKALDDYRAAGLSVLGVPFPSNAATQGISRFLQSPTGAIFGGREEDLKKQIAFLKFLEQQQQKAALRGSEFEGFDEALKRARSGIAGGFKLPPPPDTSRERELLALQKQQVSAIEQMEQRKASLLNLNEQELLQLRVTTGSYRKFNDETVVRLMNIAVEIDKRKQNIDRINSEAAAQQHLAGVVERLGDLQLGAHQADIQANRDLEFQNSLIGKGADERERAIGLRAIELEAQARQRQRAELLSGFPATLEEETRRIERAAEERRRIWTEHLADRLRLERDWQTGAAQAMDDFARSVSDQASQVRDVYRDVFQGLEDAIVRFVTTGKLSFRDLANSVIADLVRIQVRKSIVEPFSGVIGGGLKSIFSSIFGRAGGGPVSPGVAFRVGEHGPETFIPATAGSVVPESRMGGQTVVNMSFVVNSLDPRSAAQVIAANAPVILDVYRRALNARGVTTPLG